MSVSHLGCLADERFLRFVSARWADVVGTHEELREGSNKRGKDRVGCGGASPIVAAEAKEWSGFSRRSNMVRKTTCEML